MNRDRLVVMIILVTAVIAAIVILVPSYNQRRAMEDQAPAPAPTPVTAIYEGHVFNCAQVAQLTSEGEWYTPDGYHIPAIMLMDCDI